jgi:hypothetical protein
VGRIAARRAVVMIKVTWGGGSSRIFRRELRAASCILSAFSMMITFAAPAAPAWDQEETLRRSAMGMESRFTDSQIFFTASRAASVRLASLSPAGSSFPGRLY